MADPFTALIIGFGIGALGGALSAFLGWNKSGEPFDPRKFISGLVTGIIAGIALVMASAQLIQDAAADQAQLLIAYVGIILAVIGVDNARTSISSAITKPEGTA